ncbi:unnamed protein product [Chironomus riparius]|uniref:C2H2-type domain-containing protein n=1 Tax=Chironomus riparius TaxID=315576 RepID=A0A9P0NNG0_9DIPT|nr:unnamed protein product [Chironomus riparius]
MSLIKLNRSLPHTKECCFICKQYTRFHVNIIRGKSNYSKRKLKDLIEQISNVEISRSSVICQMCLIKLQNYDEYSMKAMTAQMELKYLLDKQDDSMFMFQKVKIEDDDDQETEKEEELESYNYSANDYLLLSEEDRPNMSTFYRPRILQSPKEIYPCDYPNCEKIFKTRSKLSFHKTFHTSERNYQCHLCHKYYKTSICLRSHMRIHYNANRRVICDMCGDSFTTKQSVLRHFTTAHLKLRPYICQVCGANFGTLVILRLHLMTHGDGSNKNFACEICTSRFYSRSKLNRHMRGHGEKQFECAICHRKYTQRYNLNAHIRAAHGDENVQTVEVPKRFVCQLCGTCFVTNNELETHLKIYHEDLQKINYSNVF